MSCKDWWAQCIQSKMADLDKELDGFLIPAMLWQPALRQQGLDELAAGGQGLCSLLDIRA